MTIEQRVDQLEKQGKRLRLTVLVLAVALCGMVSMAAQSTFGRFDVVQTRLLWVVDEDGVQMVTIGGSKKEGGHITLRNHDANVVVTIDEDEQGRGEIGVWNRKGKGRVYSSQ